MQFQGFEVDLLPNREWVKVLGMHARKAEHPLSSLVPYFSVRLAPDDLTLLETRQYRPDILNKATAAALEGSGLRCPPMDHALLSTWFDRFAADGFMSVE